MASSTSGFGRRPRGRLDQSGVPESESGEGTVVLGKQPDETTEATPARKSAAKSTDT